MNNNQIFFTKKKQFPSFFSNKSIFNNIKQYYGSGIHLYFKLLFKIFKLFLLLSLISYGCLYINIQGNYIFGEFRFDLNIYSIANINYQEGNQNISSKAKYSLIFYHIFDQIQSLLFFIYTYYLRFYAYKRLFKSQISTTSVRNYSIEVNKLPKSIKKAQDLSHFFQYLNNSYFEVEECFLFKDYFEILKYFQLKQNIINQLKLKQNKKAILCLNTCLQNNQISHQKTLNSLENGVKVINQAIKKAIQKQKYKEELNIIKGFVIFSDIESRNEIIRLFKRNKSKFKYIQKYILQIAKANDPYSYLWENINSLSKIGHFVHIKLVFYVILLSIPSIIAIQYFNAKQPYINEKYECFFEGKEVKEKDFCNKNQNLLFGFIIGIFLHLVFNGILFILNMQKYCSKFDRNKSVFNVSLIQLLLNGFIIVFLLNIQLPFNIKPSYYASYLFIFIPISKENLNIGTSINRVWLYNVGQKIFYVYMFSYILFLSQIFFKHIVFEILLKKNCEKQNIDSIIQKLQIQIRIDDISINSNSSFTLPEKYSYISYLCYAGFIFAGPMPLILLIASASILTLYVYHRFYYYMLTYLYIYKEYQRLDEEYILLGIHFLKSLPICGILHMFFSFTCYCFGDIFAYNSLTNMLDCRKEGELFQIYCQLAFLVLLALMIAVFIILDVFNANKSIKKYIKNKTFSNIKQTNYKSIIPQLLDEDKLISYDIILNDQYNELMSGIEIEYADVEFNLIFGVNKSKVVNKKLQNLRKTLNESKSIKLSNTIIFDQKFSSEKQNMSSKKQNHSNSQRNSKNMVNLQQNNILNKSIFFQSKPEIQYQLAQEDLFPKTSHSENQEIEEQTRNQNVEGKYDLRNNARIKLYPKINQIEKNKM